jgi:hypothetical protein
MQKLLSELTRLYLPAGSVSPEQFAQQLEGQASYAVHLASDDGMTRAMVIAFQKTADSADGHWTSLCAMANGLQGTLGLPAPAVSISGADEYGLWLSFAAPTPIAQAQEFLTLLHKAYRPDVEVRPDAVRQPVPLLPCMHQMTGKWSAYIHPGLGASFLDDMGLEMAPPLGAQVGFLEQVESISAAQFMHALMKLRQLHGNVAAASAPAPQQGAAPAGLLLKDASLEDIVRHLHAMHIEPTFRHRFRD